MSHMSDEHGCSKCKPGEERFERFPIGSPLKPGARELRVQYEYRTLDGALFSTVAPTLETARRDRDRWLGKETA